MEELNIQQTAKGLISHAFEQQNGWERPLQEGHLPWPEQRRFWVDAVLQGMARLKGQESDPSLMKQYDDAMKHGFPPSTVRLRRATIRNLLNFVSAMEETGDDHRRQVDMIGDLLGDILLNFPWSNPRYIIFDAISDVRRTLLRMTASLPIRFTRIVLGGENGPPWEESYVSGAVTDAAAVKQTSVYKKAVKLHPEIKSWPVLCVVYTGAGLSSAAWAVDASDYDLEIMSRTWTKILDEPNVNPISGGYQMVIQV